MDHDSRSWWTLNSDGACVRDPSRKLFASGFNTGKVVRHNQGFTWCLIFSDCIFAGSEAHSARTEFESFRHMFVARMALDGAGHSSSFVQLDVAQFMMRLDSSLKIIEYSWFPQIFPKRFRA